MLMNLFKLKLKLKLNYLFYLMHLCEFNAYEFAYMTIKCKTKLFVLCDAFIGI
jgi:hypothetical protein